ncbi:MAG: CmcI family methyltransferase [Anaerolineaceae bacterium]|nr:CmcI family methyltransferase [Anaerolineaceae bacterium]
MAEKKVFTRAEFSELLQSSAAEMKADQELQDDALHVLVRADHYRWIHQTSWLGEPVLNLPQDMFAIQEIIFKTHPQFILEVGVAWGGGVLFHATLLEALGGKKVIGIDTFMPEDLRQRLMSHGKISDRIELIQGSSVESETFEKVKMLIGDCRHVLVILDSFHTHEHVLKELRLYSPIIGKGHYLICGDTIIEDIPIQEHRPRPWGPGNNPKTAIAAFLKENDRFEIDTEIENKLLMTCNPGGYLRCRKD